MTITGKAVINCFLQVVIAVSTFFVVGHDGSFGWLFAGLWALIVQAPFTAYAVYLAVRHRRPAMGPLMVSLAGSLGMFIWLFPFLLEFFGLR
jgi:hypothetical protein